MKTAFTLLTVSFQVSLVITVFSYALRARREDLRYLWHEPRLLLLSLIALFVLTPALALVLVKAIDPPVTAQVAIVALSLSIVPPLLPQKELAAGGHASYAIALTIFSAVLAIVIIPAQVRFLGDLTDHPYGVPAGEVAGVVGTLVALPLIVGTLVGRLWPGAGERIGAPATRLAGLVTTVACVILLIATLPKVLDFIGAGTVLAMVLFNVGALAVGHLMGGPEPDRAIVLGLSCASRHPSVALTIATVNYPGRNFAAAVILCLVINAVVCPPYVKWMQRRAQPGGARPDDVPGPASGHAAGAG